LNINKIGHYFPVGLSRLLCILRDLWEQTRTTSGEVEVKVGVEVEVTKGMKGRRPHHSISSFLRGFGYWDFNSGF
jgi:hypothetical protein